MSERDANSNPELLRASSGGTVKADVTRLAAAQNLHVQWLEPVDPKGLRDGLLGGEARREMLTREALGLAVRKLAWMKELGLELRGPLEPVK